MTDAALKSTPPQAGHNKPPFEQFYKELNDDLPSYLAAELAPEIDRAVALVANAASVPDVIENDEQEDKATDIVSQMNKHAKVIEGRRMALNVGPRTAKDIIDGFCKTKGTEPLEKAALRINGPLTKFKREKVERERRAREERERLAREEAERQRQAAAEAERACRVAEEAKRKAEQEQREAEERRRQAIEAARQADERKRKAEEDARLAEIRAEEAKSKAAKARAEREAREANERVAEEQRQKQKAIDDAARAKLDEAAARTEKALAKGELADASKESKTATSLANASQRDARQAEKAVDAKASEMSGSRGDYGGHSSLRTFWVGDIVDIKKMDLNQLREFMAEADIQKAVNAYVRIHKGNGKLKGVSIYESTSTTVR